MSVPTPPGKQQPPAPAEVHPKPRDAISEALFEAGKFIAGNHLNVDLGVVSDLDVKMMKVVAPAYIDGIKAAHSNEHPPHHGLSATPANLPPKGKGKGA